MDAIRDRDYLFSFGKMPLGEEDPFDEQVYADLIEARTRGFPGGYVMVEKIGGLWDRLRCAPQNSRVGQLVISLFCLVPALRGTGYGQQLTQYAEGVFRRHGVSEYHLRVSPTNEPALHFYSKCGLVKIREEQHRHVMWRSPLVCSDG